MVMVLSVTSDAGRAPRSAASESNAELHYSVKELSDFWGLSERTIRRMIEDEAGVIRAHQNSRRRRIHRRVQIAASVAGRIHRKVTQR